MPIKGPYMKPEHAARYCGQSKREWETMLAMFDIPLSGPFANVYATSVLDDLMAFPQKYLKSSKRPRRHLAEHPQKSVMDQARELARGGKSS